MDAVERLVNLAFFLANASEPVPRERIRTEVAGYPSDQDEAAFLRMFERDKDDLRRFGFAIEGDESGLYRLDAAATYASEIELSEEEAAAIRAAGDALVDDDSFPFPEDLRLALAKLPSAAEVERVPAAIALAAQRAPEQGALAGAMARAAEARKRVSFGYTNARGERATRHLEPYGLFVRDGRWYVVGNDSDRDELRVFALERAHDLTVNEKAAKTHDFERPADFDVASYIMLPFQYGPGDAAFEAVLRFGPSVAWRARALSAGRGSLEEDGDAVRWRVPARDVARLARYAMENGPGIEIVEPAEAVAAQIAALEEVQRIHG